MMLRASSDIVNCICKKLGCKPSSWSLMCHLVDLAIQSYCAYDHWTYIREHPLSNSKLKTISIRFACSHLILTIFNSHHFKLLYFCFPLRVQNSWVQLYILTAVLVFFFNNLYIKWSASSMGFSYFGGDWEWTKGCERELVASEEHEHWEWWEGVLLVTNHYVFTIMQVTGDEAVK